jgi:hypothetical protein
MTNATILRRVPLPPLPSTFYLALCNQPTRRDSLELLRAGKQENKGEPHVDKETGQGIARRGKGEKNRTSRRDIIAHDTRGKGRKGKSNANRPPIVDNKVGKKNYGAQNQMRV